LWFGALLRRGRHGADLLQQHEYVDVVVHLSDRLALERSQPLASVLVR
jgi:hypothetical protein